MDFRKRLMGACASRLTEETNDSLETSLPISFQPGEFIERILLFEEYIIDSFRLSEIPHLVKIFGYGQTLELLDSRTIRIYSDTFCGHGSTGRLSGASDYRARKGDLPLYEYCIDPLRIVPYTTPEEHSNEYDEYQKQYIHQNLQQINNIPNLTFRESKELRKSVARRVIQLSSEDISNEITTKTYSDFHHNNPSIKLAIANSLKKSLNLDIDPHLIELKIDFLDDKDFHVTTNLKHLMGLSDEILDKLIASSLLAISNSNQQVAKMKEFNCIVGYKDEAESLIFSGNLDFLVKQAISSERIELNFQKVVTAKGLPDFEQASLAGDIDLSKVLKIRDKPECKEFRQWIWNEEDINEKELKEALESFSQLFNDFRISSTGKSLMLVMAAVPGVVLSPVIGGVSSVAYGVLDKFILDKILPRKGPLSFINDNLTSIYNDPYFLYKLKNEE